MYHRDDEYEDGGGLGPGGARQPSPPHHHPSDVHSRDRQNSVEWDPYIEERGGGDALNDYEASADWMFYPDGSRRGWISRITTILFKVR
jgi:hypothetical protein